MVDILFSHNSGYAETWNMKDNQWESHGQETIHIVATIHFSIICHQMGSWVPGWKTALGLADKLLKLGERSLHLSHLSASRWKSQIWSRPQSHQHHVHLSTKNIAKPTSTIHIHTPVPPPSFPHAVSVILLLYNHQLNHQYPHVHEGLTAPAVACSQRPRNHHIHW